MTQQQAATNTQTTGSDEAPKNPLLRCKEYDIPAATVDKTVDDALAQQGRKTKLKGFRPGKAPLSVLRPMLGKETLHRVLMERAQHLFEDDRKGTDERVAAMPFFTPAEIATGGVYRVSCEYEVLPPILDADFSGKTLKVPTLTVGEAEVDEMIEILRNRHGEYIPAAEAAKKDSRVLIDFQTYQDGKDEPVEEGKDRFLLLGDTHLRPEFDKALQGTVAGDVRDADFLIPEDHPNELLRGKTVKAKITVKEVQVLKKAELDEAFFTGMGVEKDGGLAAFRELVTKHLQREVGVRLRNLRQRRSLDTLIDATPTFPLPQTLVYHESNGLLQRARQHWQQRGGDNMASSLRLENFVEEAQRRVSLGLVLSAWQQRHKPEITEADKEARLDEIAEAYEAPEEAKAQIRTNAQQMEAVHLSILEDKVTDWVCEQITSEEEKLPLSQLFDDEMRTNPVAAAR